MNDNVVQGIDLSTLVYIQCTKRKKTKKEAIVVEAFRHKYIKVDLVDEEDHVFKMLWDGTTYSSKFLDMPMTCDYDVERNFSANKTQIASGQDSKDRKTVTIKRSRSGKPVSQQS